MAAIYKLFAILSCAVITAFQVASATVTFFQSFQKSFKVGFVQSFVIILLAIS